MNLFSLKNLLFTCEHPHSFTNISKYIDTVSNSALWVNSYYEPSHTKILAKISMVTWRLKSIKFFLRWVFCCIFSEVKHAEKFQSLRKLKEEEEKKGWKLWLTSLNITTYMYIALKPQDSLGRFVAKFSRYSESGPYNQKAPLNPPAIVLNDML